MVWNEDQEEPTWVIELSQKRNLNAFDKRPYGFCFSVQVGLRQIQALNKTNQKRMNKIHVIPMGVSQFVCRRPSRVPKRRTRGHFSMPVWFRFWCLNQLLISVGKCLIWRGKPWIIPSRKYFYVIFMWNDFLIQSPTTRLARSYFDFIEFFSIIKYLHPLKLRYSR